jgi:glucose uptake protein GlcU
VRGISPLVLNYWVAEGVGVAGLLFLAVPPRVFSWLGMLSGALFVASAANAVTAIGLIGLSAASGLWCGTAVLVSFAYGVLVAGDHVESMELAAAALGLILCGIGGIALAAWAGGSNGGSSSDGAADGGGGAGWLADSQASLLEEDDAEAAAGSPAAAIAAVPAGSRPLLGLLAAVLAGVLGGLILAPMVHAPPEARGIQFVPSVGLGALVVAPILTAILTCTPRTRISLTQVCEPVPAMRDLARKRLGRHARDCSGVQVPVLNAVPCPAHACCLQATSSRAAGPGMAAGVVWQLGNACCIAAVTNPHVGLAVAMPIMQVGRRVFNLLDDCLFAAQHLAGVPAPGSRLYFSSLDAPPCPLQCGLFVAGVWGIALFREITGWRALATYWVSGVLLVAGAGLLAAAKGG